jgi:hypothetical protein
MVSEETTLQSLLRNRKIVRNYKESKLEFPQLSEVAEHAIKIPTAGFSRGIEIVHISEKKILLLLQNIQMKIPMLLKDSKNGYQNHFLCF